MKSKKSKSQLKAIFANIKQSSNNRLSQLRHRIKENERIHKREVEEHRTAELQRKAAEVIIQKKANIAALKEHEKQEIKAAINKERAKYKAVADADKRRAATISKAKKDLKKGLIKFFKWLLPH